MPDPTPAALRRLDALAAEKVMGWPMWNGGGWAPIPSYQVFSWGDVHRYTGHSEDENIGDDWSPTTSIADAMELVEKLPKGCMFSLNLGMDGWWAVAYPPGQPVVETSYHDSPALAITFAALRAVGVPEKEISDAQ